VTGSPNKSLERTPDEQGCFALSVVCGRRSAHRSALLKAKDGVFQVAAFESRDSGILAAQFRSLSSNVVHECRLLIPACSFGVWAQLLGQKRHFSPLSSLMRCLVAGAPVHSAEPNQSLERTAAEQISFAAVADGGRRSALRWTAS